MKYWVFLPNNKQEKLKPMLWLKTLGDYTRSVLNCHDREISSLVHFIINKLVINFPNR